MAYLTQTVHRGAAPQRGGKKHATPRGLSVNLIFALHTGMINQTN